MSNRPTGGVWNNKNGQIGREYEYETAKYIWEKLHIPTFPSPTPLADLITPNGVLIEVKSRRSQGIPQLSRRQMLNPAFDIIVVWYKDCPSVIPAPALEKVIQAAIATGKGAVGIPQEIILTHLDNWDLIEEYKKLRAVTD